MKKVAVIGGGITGISAAHRINELAPDVEVHLFESKRRLGGVLHTESFDNYLVEHSADMFTTKDRAAIELCQRIGFADELIGTNSKFQQAFIAQGDRLVPVPKGLNLMTPSDLDAIQQCTLLSESGRKRFLEEDQIKAKPSSTDESLASFAKRRFGVEAFEKIIQPLVGGIYTADPEKLSMRATLPQYLEMESKHGSIIGAANSNRPSGDSNQDKNTSGARYHLFVAPQNGMVTLIEAIKRNFGRTQIVLDRTVTGLSKSASGSWSLSFDSNSEEEFDGVIVTCPCNHAAKLFEPEYSLLVQLLESIEYASSAIVVNGFDRNQIEHELNGFGFVVPLSENRNILAGSFASVKFDGRCNNDQVLTRTFVGGGCQAELLQNTDDEIIRMALADLSDFLKISGGPKLTQIVRWTNSMPQYHVGHTDLVANIENEINKIENLEMAGKCFHGVGIPACVASGEQAAENLITNKSGHGSDQDSDQDSALNPPLW